MSQAGIAKTAVIPPGTYIEELQGDLGTPVGGAIVSILGNGDVTPTTLANSGIVFTGDGVSTLSSTLNYINIPDGVTGNPNGRLYQTSLFNGIRVFYHNGNGLGTGNSFFGIDSGATALTDATIAGGNTGVGQSSLVSLAPGAFNNTALGDGAGTGITSGAENIAVGAGAYSSPNPSGSRNIIIGSQAGDNIVAGASDNIFIGYGIQGGLGPDNNTLRIGTGDGVGSGILTKAYIAGIDGVNVGSVAKVVTMASDQLGTATITAGAGIVVTPGANTITIASIGSGLTWSVITANQTAVVENGYFCNKASTLALTLPTTSAVGDVIEVTNENTALGVQFTQAAGQQILIGNTNTTLGATGTLTSSAVGDTLKIVCKTANTIWRVSSGWGNWTPA